MGFRFSPLYSSSSGNATFVATEKTSILIDAGTTGSALEAAFSSLGEKTAALSAILVTHEHTDHIKGVGVLSRRYDIPVYANAKTWEAMQHKIGEIAVKNIRIIETEKEFYIDDICISPFSLSHDAADPLGYAIMSGNKKVGVLTDTGRVTNKMLNALDGASLVLLESNHDIEMLQNGIYPYYLKKRILSTKGHLSNVDAGVACLELLKRGVKEVILGHISSKNNHKQLAYDTVCGSLDDSGVIVGKDIDVRAARRTGVTDLFLLKE
ncbi:MAG: MBL fold metallo-hydrolase [Christensenellaceae bacterium]|jgi:phosphoribosyl 1,2-cyclic phosphodiesterase